MPSTSAKQAKFMRAVAHSPKFAKKVGVPQSVGKDFEMADKKKVKKFGEGGWGMKLPRKDDSSIKKLPTKMSPKDESGIKKLPTKMPSKDGSGVKKFGDGGKLKLTDKEKKMGDALMMTRKGKEVMDAQKRMESVKEMQRRKKQAAADKLLGVGMKEGGMMKKATKSGRAMVKKSADTMGRAMVKKAGGGKCYAKGGSVSSRADGVAKKGKTDTKMVKMARGGMMAKMTPRTEYGGVERRRGGKC